MNFIATKFQIRPRFFNFGANSLSLSLLSLFLASAKSPFSCSEITAQFLALQIHFKSHFDRKICTFWVRFFSEMIDLGTAIRFDTKNLVDTLWFFTGKDKISFSSEATKWREGPPAFRQRYRQSDFWSRPQSKLKFKIDGQNLNICQFFLPRSKQQVLKSLFLKFSSMFNKSNYFKFQLFFISYFVPVLALVCQLKSCRLFTFLEISSTKKSSGGALWASLQTVDLSDYCSGTAHKSFMQLVAADPAPRRATTHETSLSPIESNKCRSVCAYDYLKSVRVCCCYWIALRAKIGWFGLLLTDWIMYRCC